MWAIVFCTVVASLCAQLALGHVNERGLHVLDSVTLENGHAIDWVEAESQGSIAKAPPRVSLRFPWSNTTAGPAGAVPFLRRNSTLSPKKQHPERRSFRYSDASVVSSRQYAGKHWYASASQSVPNHGSSGTISMFKAQVAEGDDFSLLQMAIIRDDSSLFQTVEAGWISYPDKSMQPSLFTYYTTNDYQAVGDYLGGWNTEVKGWVQVDHQYYPGAQLAPLSAVGGNQNDFQLRFEHFNGNWWLSVNGRWIGYYPASIFTKPGQDPNQTLESMSNRINWYGEIAQSEAGLTTSTMGSGQYAGEGYGQAAYLRNLKYTNTLGQDGDFDGSSGIVVSDPTRYSIDAHWDATAPWGHHVFVGGPGAHV